MLICDSESDGFKYEATKIWVICCYNTDTKRYSFSFHEPIPLEERFKYRGLKPSPESVVFDSHEDHLKYMQREEVCFHNYFQHDKPLIKKFYPDFQPKEEHDSYILSQLFNPDRGKHGLSDWGERFGIPKPKHEEWDRFSPEMLHRVIEDVKINVEVWKHLMKEKEAWEKLGQSWDEAIKIEYGIADLQGRQEMYGTLLDVPKAYDLADEIYLEIQKIDEQLLQQMPMRVIRYPESAYEVAPFTTTRKLKTHVINWFEGEEVVDAPFCRVSFEQINLNSYTQLKDFLLSQGWEPTEYTDKGSPQLTEDSYDSIKGELGQLIAKRAVLKHRAQMLFNITKDGQLKGWLNQVRSDGRIEAGAITNATNTGRKAHRGIVNCPKPKDFGLWPSDTQLRSLLTAPLDRSLMGIDADSLEACIEAHCCLPYKGGEEYAKALTGGTLHDDNATMLGVSRDIAKTFKYATTYGAQPKKIAASIGCSVSKAQKLYDSFWKGNTALEGFKKRITDFWKTKGQKKFIIGIDGRRISVRSEHSIVNAYFQSTGSITVKVAMLFMDKWVRNRNLKSQQVMDFHDEYTYEVYPGEDSSIMELAPKSFDKASKYLKLRIPVTGTPALGRTWEEIH